MRLVLLRGLLVLVVFGVMAGVFELGFRLAGYRPLYEIYSKPSIFWRYHPERGWAHEPHSRGVYRGPRPYPIEFENEVRINAEGLRGPEIPPPDPDRYRILFLGDSVVAAFEVAERQTFVALLERRLERRFRFDVETINGGVRGYGTDQSYLHYKQDLHRLQADLVILHYSRNDPRNNMTLHRARRPFGKSAFALTADGRLSLQGAPVPDYPLCSHVMMNPRFEVESVDTALSRGLCGLEHGLSDRSAFFTWVTRILRGMPQLVRWLYRLGDASREVAGHVGLAPAVAHADEGDPASLRLTRAIVIALAREVEATGAQFVFWLHQPELDELGRADLDAADVDILATPPLVLDSASTPISFQNDSHWNPNGHQLLSDRVFPRLERRIHARLGAKADRR